MPIIEIAQSYKWDYKAEYALRDQVPKKGAYKKIDFAFAYNNQVVGLEVKFPNYKNLALKTEKVVTKDVPDYALMVDNSARQTGWMCQCGEKLNSKLHCTACNKKYKKTKTGLQPTP